MWAPQPNVVAAALDHAAACVPKESCGVVADGAYWPLDNRATEFDSFIMDRRGYCRIDAAHRVEAIVHSHVLLPPIASEADCAMCEKLGLPWLIVSHPGGRWTVIEPAGWQAPLIGRQWAWGTQDCYGLVRDGLRAFTGIALPDFPRDWQWWKDGGDMIAEHFAPSGFRPMPEETPPQHCDVMAMRIRSPVANHLALFQAPDRILHQMLGRLSVRELYDGFYQDATVLHLRHESFCDG
jgi:proteasome lid subunit RPN8/RPN11